MEKLKPQISIIVPIYNEEKTILQILKIVSTKIELSKYIQLIIHLGSIDAIVKKNKKKYSTFLDIKKIMQI